MSSLLDDLKEAISTEPVLNWQTLTCHLRCTLMPLTVPNDYLVAFESKKLKEVEQRYATHGKEMTVLVYCFDTWKDYMLSTRLTMVT